MIGKTLGGRFTVRSVLGRGGMGVVYEAKDEESGKLVALKVLNDVNPRTAERFRQEALAASSIASRHIVKAYGFEATEEATFFVMELVRGETLAKIFDREKPLAIDRAVGLVDQVLAALADAHRAGVVHRDVKPSNVLVTVDDAGNEKVKLTDFGVAKLLAHDGVRTTTGTILGTTAYLAPEQILGTAIDPRADLHAVGIILWQLLAGRRPFIGHASDIAVAIVRDPPPALTDFRPEVPRALVDAIMRALAKAPDDRFASAEAMRAAIGPWRPRRSIAPESVRPAQPRKRTRTFVRALFVTLALGALVMFGIVLAALVRPAKVVAIEPAVVDASEARVEAPPSATLVEASPPLPSAEAQAKHAARPRADRKTCHCRVHRSGGVVVDLCEEQLPPRCRCETEDSAPLCPVLWRFGDLRPEVGCPTITKPGVHNDVCSGFTRDGVKKSGWLKCEVCYAPERHRPWTKGKHGDECRGLFGSATIETGVMECD